jgi:IS5 family transposase
LLFEPLLDTNPGVSRRRGRRGRPRRRPEKLHADKGYDFPRCRSYLHRRGIKVRIARREAEEAVNGEDGDHFNRRAEFSRTRGAARCWL